MQDKLKWIEIVEQKPNIGNNLDIWALNGRWTCQNRQEGASQLEKFWAAGLGHKRILPSDTWPSH